MFIRVALLALSGSLATLATGGRRGRPLRIGKEVLTLALIYWTFKFLLHTHRKDRMSAGMVSPSAALVLY